MIIRKDKLVEDILKHIDVDNLYCKDSDNNINNIVDLALRIYAPTDYEIYILLIYPLLMIINVILLHLGNVNNILFYIYISACLAIVSYSIFTFYVGEQAKGRYRAVKKHMNYITYDLQFFLKRKYNLNLLNCKEALIKAISDTLPYRMFKIILQFSSGIGIINVFGHILSKNMLYPLLAINIIISIIIPIFVLLFYHEKTYKKTECQKLSKIKTKCQKLLKIKTEYQKLLKIKYVLENIF